MTNPKGSMTGFLVVVLCLFVGGAAPATRKATTKPAMIDLRPLEEDVAAAQSAVENAKAEARAKWEASDDYKQLKGEAERTRLALEKARGGDDAKAKLDASKVYNDARLALAKADAARLRNVGQEETAAVDRAKAKLQQAIQHNRDVEENSPIRVAMREKRVMNGMTRDQLLEMFGKPVEATESPRGTICVYQVKGPALVTDHPERYRAQQFDPSTTAINRPENEFPLEVKREIVVTFRGDVVVDFRDTKLR
jgi:hypothetical protein